MSPWVQHAIVVLTVWVISEGEIMHADTLSAGHEPFTFIKEPVFWGVWTAWTVALLLVYLWQ